MAFVDVTVPYAQGGVGGGGVSATVGGAPQGGGIRGGGVPVASGPPGSGGPGTNVALKHWILAFYLFIAAALVSAGVIFNGKG